MAKLILLGPAHDAAGRREDVFDGATLEDVLGEAVIRYGSHFEALLDTSQVWINGEPAARSTPLGPHDEILVLPPVSGG
jgi:molybdopterin converting factor small subunit